MQEEVDSESIDLEVEFEAEADLGLDKADLDLDKACLEGQEPVPRLELGYRRCSYIHRLNTDSSIGIRNRNYRSRRKDSKHSKHGLHSSSYH